MDAIHSSSPWTPSTPPHHQEFRDSIRGRLLSLGVSLRTRLLGLPYGDQGLLVRRETFRSIGGFKDWPLLEDLEMVERLRRIAPPAIVDAPVVTSGRCVMTVRGIESVNVSC